MTGKRYRLTGADGQEVLSTERGRLGGNRRRKIYGQLDCRSAVGALRHLHARGVSGMGATLCTAEAVRARTTSVSSVALQ